MSLADLGLQLNFRASDSEGGGRKNGGGAGVGPVPPPAQNLQSGGMVCGEMPQQGSVSPS